jgi:hypothetical protein
MFEMTTTSAVQMQQRLNCYAVINEKYRKSNAAKSEPAFDLDREICDLNRLDTYRDTPPYEEFVGALVKFAKQITASGKAPYIFHLHGIPDKSKPGIPDNRGKVRPIVFCFFQYLQTLLGNVFPNSDDKLYD